MGNLQKLTNFKWLNLFEVNDWIFASRKPYASTIEGAELESDAVLIVAKLEDKLVVVNQFRQPIGDQVWELPAGLIDKGETALQAAKREFKEETGLDFYPYPDSEKETPLLVSPGMSDEVITIFYGVAYGEIEPEQHINVELWDWNKVRDILKHEPRKTKMVKLDVKLWFVLQEILNND